MYDQLGAALPGLTACDWPKAGEAQSFGELASSCIATYGITRHDLVAGCSMGGMVAAEMYAQLDCRALLLIGSCTEPSAVPLHRLAALGSRLLPERLLGLSARSVPGAMRLRSALLADPAFVRWSLDAFSRWRGARLPPHSRVHHIHGLLDPIIPVINVRPERIIRSGGHLIAITHHRQVARFLGSVLDRLSAPPAATAGASPPHRGSPPAGR